MPPTSRSVLRRVLAVALVPAAFWSAGCGSNRLETGYQYTPLGATPVQRRAYYAGPFSPEARDAAMSRDADDTSPAAPSRRGRPGA